MQLLFHCNSRSLFYVTRYEREHLDNCFLSCELLFLYGIIKVYVFFFSNFTVGGKWFASKMKYSFELTNWR